MASEVLVPALQEQGVMGVGFAVLYLNQSRIIRSIRESDAVELDAPTPLHRRILG